MKKLILLLLVGWFGLSLSAQNVVEGEYFFDAKKDYGAGTPIAVSPDSDISVNTTFGISSLPEGLHRLFVRFKDSAGKWGQTMNYTIFVKRETASTVVAGEYFFDTVGDYGAGNSMNLLNVGSTNEVVQNLDVTGLSDGLYRLFVRFKDNNGFWSQTMNFNIFIKHNKTQVIDTGEYFFNQVGDYGTGMPFPIVDISANTIISDLIEIPNSLPQGNHVLFFRFRDNNNRWSQTFSKSIFKSDPVTISLDSIGNAVSGLQNGFVEISIAGGMSPYSFEWKRDSTIISNLEDVMNLPPGNYSVSVTDVNGCTEEANYIIDNVVGISDINSQKSVQVFPNPTTGFLNLRFELNQKSDLQIELSDNIGRILLVENHPKTSINSLTLDLSSFVSGIYLLKIFDEKNVLSKKIILSR